MALPLVVLAVASFVVCVVACFEALIGALFGVVAGVLLLLILKSLICQRVLWQRRNVCAKKMNLVAADAETLSTIAIVFALTAAKHQSAPAV